MTPISWPQAGLSAIRALVKAWAGVDGWVRSVRVGLRGDDIGMSALARCGDTWLTVSLSAAMIFLRVVTDACDRTR